MRSATRFALAALALVLWSGSAAAQNNVTFQVDLSQYVTSCQFNPATDTPFVRGSFQTPPFNTSNPLTAAGNGIYSATVSIPAGGITYKFYVGQTATPGTPGLVGWENGNDRAYTVTAGAQTIAPSAFNGPAVASICGSPQYDVLFAVDMSIAQGRGAFRPADGETVAAVGEFNGWDTGNPAALTEDSFTPGLYTGISARTLAAPSATGFKFIIRNANGTVKTWDSVNPAATPDNSGGGDPNRIIRILGGEPDTDGNGRPNFVYDNDANPNTSVYFQDASAAQFLTGPATVTFNIDMRPAQYRITDAGALPPGEGSDPPSGNTAFGNVFINGPAAGESNEDSGPGGGLGDWAAWGTVLSATTARQMTDANADGIYTITLNYSAGAFRNLVHKYGVGGADNEAGSGANHTITAQVGSNTFNLSFGCMRRVDGSFTDVTTMGTVVNPYDEYLLINNVVQPETCTVLRNGGGNDIFVAAENGPSISGLAISAAYPNPATTAGRIALTLDRPMAVVVRAYDVTGRQVATLADGRALAAGTTVLDFDTSALASGVYVLRIEADGQVASRRLTVTR